jgi:hypothetical protein
MSKGAYLGDGEVATAAAAAAGTSVNGAAWGGSTLQPWGSSAICVPTPSSSVNGSHGGSTRGSTGGGSGIFSLDGMPDLGTILQATSSKSASQNAMTSVVMEVTTAGNGNEDVKSLEDMTLALPLRQENSEDDEGDDNVHEHQFAINNLGVQYGPASVADPSRQAVSAEVASMSAAGGGGGGGGMHVSDSSKIGKAVNGAKEVAGDETRTAKSAETKRMLIEVMKKSVLFASLETDTLRTMADCMYCVDVAASEPLMEEGAYRKAVYVIESGEFEVHQRAPKNVSVVFHAPQYSMSLPVGSTSPGVIPMASDFQVGSITHASINHYLPRLDFTTKTLTRSLFFYF